LNRESALGFAISSVGAFLGTIFMLAWFVSYFGLQYSTEIARGAPTEALLVSYVLPAIVNIAMAGGILWVLSAYGFWSGRKWAFSVAMAASILCILAGFFPILPWVSSGLGFPPTSIAFGANLLFFVLLQVYVEPAGRKVIMLGLLSGISYILAFIDGIAGEHYVLTTGGLYYMALQPLNLVASAMWGVTTLALVLGKGWAKPIALAAAAASMLGGVPIAIASQAGLGRPSLFWPSPLAALLTLAIVFASDRTKQA
jgi:hypothetical protein